MTVQYNATVYDSETGFLYYGVSVMAT